MHYLRCLLLGCNGLLSTQVQGLTEAHVGLKSIVTNYLTMQEELH
jgi:hypothetical protein